MEWTDGGWAARVGIGEGVVVGAGFVVVSGGANVGEFAIRVGVGRVGKGRAPTGITWEIVWAASACVKGGWVAWWRW